MRNSSEGAERREEPEGSVQGQGQGQGQRPRNRRGQGQLLRAQILQAAADILGREGSDDAVTLRSVAREVGIAAPSIYAHFADREAIVDAVVDAAFEELNQRVSAQAGDVGQDPVERLYSGCLAYVRFALEEPGTYRILFDRRRGAGTELRNQEERLAGFRVLVEGLAQCVAVGRSGSTDPFVDATELWAGLHGAVSLRVGAPGFPWPAIEESVRLLVDRLGVIVAEG